MKDPKAIETVIEGAAYHIPTFKVTDNGLEDGSGVLLLFCKGNKDDVTLLRQEGFISETLLQVVKQYMESVNVGDVASRESSMAITKLDEALMWLQKRSDDRKLRGVQGTYKK